MCVVAMEHCGERRRRRVIDTERWNLNQNEYKQQATVEGKREIVDKGSGRLAPNMRYTTSEWEGDTDMMKQGEE